MRVTYDSEADSAYIQLGKLDVGGVAYTYITEPEIETGMINLDFDREGRLLGIEVLSASRSLPQELHASATRP